LNSDLCIEDVTPIGFEERSLSSGHKADPLGGHESKKKSCRHEKLAGEKEDSVCFLFPLPSLRNPGQGSAMDALERNRSEDLIFFICGLS